MEKLAFILEENKSKKIMDVGTGVGNFIFLLEPLLKEYDEIIGIDTSAKAIEIAKSYFTDKPKIKFMVKNAEQTDYHDNYFDIVCLSNSLHHLSEPKNIFKEMERILKPQGLMIIHEMVCEPLSDAQHSHRLIHHFSAEIDRFLGIFHDDTYTQTEIENKLKENGSCIIEDAWVPVYPEKHLFTNEEIDHIIQSIDQMLVRVRDTEQIDYFSEKAKVIKSYIKNNGFDLATQYMFVLRKPKK